MHKGYGVGARSVSGGRATAGTSFEQSEKLVSKRSAQRPRRPTVREQRNTPVFCE